MRETLLKLDWTPLNIIFFVFSALYENVVVKPLSRMYLVGYWMNRDQDKICYDITGVSEIDWGAHSTECQQVISNHFTSWIVFLETVLYFVFIGKFLLVLKNRLWNTLNPNSGLKQ